MRGPPAFRPLVQLLDDTLRGRPGRTGNAPHVRAPAGAQGLHLQFIIASLPVAVLVAWHDLLAYALQLGVALLAAAFFECLFAWQRRRPVDEGLLLTAWLFALLVPAGTPLLQAALSLGFGVVFGKLVFGGDGRYLVSPPLLGLVFLVFAYPAAVGDPVTLAPVAGNATAVALCCLAGAAWLLMTGSASWRLMAGGVAGLLLASALASVAVSSGALPEPATAGLNAAWYAPLLSGGFAFGIVFIATDPTASAMTNAGRLASGVVTGVLAALIDVLFAILLVSLVAPLFDAAAVAANIRRRRAREPGR